MFRRSLGRCLDWLVVACALCLPVMSAAAPANDDFSSSVLLTGSTGSIAGTLAESTREQGAVFITGDSSRGTVWYRWQATETGVLHLKEATHSSGLNLMALAGETPRVLAMLARDVAQLAVAVEAGETVHLQAAYATNLATLPDEQFVLEWEFVVAPTVTTPIISGTPLVGETVTLSVITQGSDSLVYSWFHDRERLVGIEGPTLTLANLTPALAGSYRVEVADRGGVDRSGWVEVSGAGLGPSILSQPTGTVREVAEALTLDVDAVGEGELTYQWRRQGFALEGETSRRLHIAALSQLDDGIYDVVVADQNGSRISRGARVTVSPHATPGVLRFRSDRHVTLDKRDGLITALAPATGGGYWVAGEMTRITANPVGRIVKLDEQGNVLASFRPREPLIGDITGVAAAQDGGLWVWGALDVGGNGSRLGAVVRLGTNGERMETFTLSTSESMTLLDAASDAVGRLYVLGRGGNTVRLWRLSAAGLIDESYTPDPDAAAGIEQIAVTSTGVVFGLGRSLMRRIDLTGAASELPTAVEGWGTTYAIAVTPTDEVVVLGAVPDNRGFAIQTLQWRRIDAEGAVVPDSLGMFQLENSSDYLSDVTDFVAGAQGVLWITARVQGYRSEGRLWKVEAVGELASFDRIRFGPSDSSGPITFASIEGFITNTPAGGVMLGGGFGQIGDVPLPQLALVSAQGGVSNVIGSLWSAGKATSLMRQPDGQVVVAGEFQLVNGIPVQNIVRLKADLNVDEGFAVGGGSNGIISRLRDDGSGRLLADGTFDKFADVSTGSKARLSRDGVVDESYVNGGKNGFAKDMIALAGGRSVSAQNWSTSHGLALFGTDGEVGRVRSINAAGMINKLTAVADGTILATGFIYSETVGFLDQPSAVARVFADGTVDPHYGYGHTLKSFLFNAVLMPDESSLHFDISGAIKLDAWGRVARTFRSAGVWSAANTEYVAQALSDGGVLLAGRVSERVDVDSVYPSARSRYWTRIKPDGSIDPRFDLPELQEPVTALLQRDDGHYLVATEGLLRLTEPEVVEFVVQPQSVEVVAGQQIRLAAEASGSNLAYAWRRNGVAIPDASDPMFTLPFASLAHAGWYDVEVSNGSETVLSARVQVKVTPSAAAGFVRASRPSEEVLLESASSRILQMNALGDGRVYVLADADTVNGVRHSNLLRLMSDGKLDPTFNIDGLLDGLIVGYALMSDGKIVVALHLPDGLGSDRVLRLNDDGSRDVTFPIVELDAYLGGVFRMADGRVLVRGTFERNPDTNTARPAIVLSADGGIDDTFEAPVVMGNVIRMIPLLDGGVLIGGQLSKADDLSVGGLIRLNSDGSFDSAFASAGGLGEQPYVAGMEQLVDGSIYIGGGLQTYNGQPVGNLIRLSPTGVLDTAFSEAFGSPNALVRSLAPSRDGSLWVGADPNNGQLLAWKVASSGEIVSELDLTNPVESSGSLIWALAETANGELWLNWWRNGSSLTKVVSSTAEILPLNLPAWRMRGPVFAAVALPDNELLVGGDFRYASGFASGPAVRLEETSDGVSTVALGADVNGTVSALIRQADDSVVMSGNFSSTEGVDGSGSGLMRVLPDGRSDATFATARARVGNQLSMHVYYRIDDRVELPDGRFVLLGGFANYQGTGRSSIARFYPDGRLDESFLAGKSGQYGYGGMALALDDLGRLYIGGDFSSWSGVPRSNVVRLLADGRVDESFPDLGLNGAVRDLAVDSEGRLLVVGAFDATGDQPTGPVTRFESDGTHDSNWALDARVHGYLNEIALQPDDSFYLWSSVGSLRDDAAHDYIVRMDKNGGLDESFRVVGLTSGMTAFAMRDDGRIFVGGWRPFPTGFLQPLEYGLPTISVAPASAQGEVGQAITLSVEASGGELTYQWRRNGIVIDGATAATYVISSATLADAGFYDVVVTNALGKVTSRTAVVAVAGAGAEFALGIQRQVGRGFKVTGTIEVTNTVTYSGELDSLAWATLVPNGWTYRAVEDELADSATSAPSEGQEALLEWTWSTGVPTSPLTFRYELVPPPSSDRFLEIVSLLSVERAGEEIQSLVTPDPLRVRNRSALHDADIDADGRLGLSELLRVIELYNTRSGTTRTGRYQVDDETDDGYGADSNGVGESALIRHHSADTDRDGRLSLSELLRMIELYNTRSGTTRTGAYRAAEGTADGYEAGTAGSG